MYLQLEASGTTHDIPLRNVKGILPGKLPSSKLVPIEVDDLDDTLVFRNSECVPLPFEQPCRAGRIHEVPPCPRLGL